MFFKDLPKFICCLISPFLSLMASWYLQEPWLIIYMIFNELTSNFFYILLQFYDMNLTYTITCILCTLNTYNWLRFLLFSFLFCNGIQLGLDSFIWFLTTYNVQNQLGIVNTEFYRSYIGTTDKWITLWNTNLICYGTVFIFCN